MKQTKQPIPRIIVDLSGLTAEQQQQVFNNETQWNDVCAVMEHAAIEHERGTIVLHYAFNDEKTAATAAETCQRLHDEFMQHRMQLGKRVGDCIHYMAGIDAAVKYLQSRFDWKECTPIELAHFIIQHYK